MTAHRLQQPSIFIGRAGRRGLTLAECLIALTILPLAVAGVAFSVTAGQQQSFEALRQERAATLAEALMEEILAKLYADPQGIATAGPDSGETSRSLYDNMDDYHGFSDTAGGVKDAVGTLYGSQYQAFGRSVTCQYTTLTLLGNTSSGLLITVTVSDTKSTNVVTVTRFVPAPS